MNINIIENTHMANSAFLRKWECNVKTYRMLIKTHTHTHTHTPIILCSSPEKYHGKHAWRNSNLLRK
jgi:hypothetical protein